MMEDKNLLLNLDSILKKIIELRPEELKTKYILKATLATNKGKGVRLDLSEYNYL